MYYEIVSFFGSLGLRDVVLSHGPLDIPEVVQSHGPFPCYAVVDQSTRSKCSLAERGVIFTYGSLSCFAFVCIIGFGSLVHFEMSSSTATPTADSGSRFGGRAPDARKRKAPARASPSRST